jgi:hypothetical protein
LPLALDMDIPPRSLGALSAGVRRAASDRPMIASGHLGAYLLLLLHEGRFGSPAKRNCSRKTIAALYLRSAKAT